MLVDALPPSQQEDGTAWAGRMVGLGNVAGYFMQVFFLFYLFVSLFVYDAKLYIHTYIYIFRGYADLVKAFPFLGDTQLKVLCVIAAIILVLSDIITCYAVTEKVLTKEPKYVYIQKEKKKQLHIHQQI